MKTHHQTPNYKNLLCSKTILPSKSIILLFTLVTTLHFILLICVSTDICNKYMYVCICSRIITMSSESTKMPCVPGQLCS